MQLTHKRVEAVNAFTSFLELQFSQNGFDYCFADGYFNHRSFLVK